MSFMSSSAVRGQTRLTITASRHHCPIKRQQVADTRTCSRQREESARVQKAELMFRTDPNVNIGKQVPEPLSRVFVVHDVCSAPGVGIR